MSRAARLDLLIPGLFGPVPVVPGDIPPLLALKRLLTRADRLAAPADRVDALLARFGVAVPEEADPPSAPFARLGDDPTGDPAGWWLHADPVHLRPDRDQLRLYDARHLDIRRDEADALVALFNAHFSADGLHLTAPVPERWYLRADTPPRIRTRPLYAAAGRSVDPRLPRGPGARDWMRLQNEVQMLFHGAPVNRRREEAGRPGINGLWTWGGGRVPDAPVRAPYAAVCATDPLTAGLARAAGVPLRPPPGGGDHATPLPDGGDLLVVWDALWGPVLDADAGAWLTALPGLEGWAVQWIAALTGGGLGTLDLDPCDGVRFRVTRAALRRFWRRGAPFAGRVRGPGSG